MTIKNFGTTIILKSAKLQDVLKSVVPPFINGSDKNDSLILKK